MLSGHLPTFTPTVPPVRSGALCSLTGDWPLVLRAGLFVLCGLYAALLGGIVSRRFGVSVAAAGVLAFALGVLLPERVAAAADLDRPQAFMMLIAFVVFATAFLVVHYHWKTALWLCEAVAAVVLCVLSGSDPVAVSFERSNASFLLCVGSVCVVFGCACEFAGLWLACPDAAVFLTVVTGTTGILTHIFAGAVSIYMLPEGRVSSIAQQEMQSDRERAPILTVNGV